jgi:hypothetical protein
MSTELERISELAKQEHGLQFTSLAHLLTVEMLGEAYQRLRKDSSPGVDGLTHRGRAGLRGVVYMATLSCLQHNPRIRAHFDRLIQRPERPLSRMQALGACMNKLLRYAFAVMKHRQPFDLAHHWAQGGDCVA